MYNKYMTANVSGVTFENRQEIIKKFTEFSTNDILVKLIREPDNKFDPSAIAVHLALINVEGTIQIGYIPKDMSKRLAPVMDRRAEESEEAVIARIVGFSGGHSNLSYGVRIDLFVNDNVSNNVETSKFSSIDDIFG